MMNRPNYSEGNGTSTVLDDIEGPCRERIKYVMASLLAHLQRHTDI